MHFIMVDIDNTICKTNEIIKKKFENFSENIYPFPLPLGFFENNPDVFRDAEPVEGAAFKLHEFMVGGNRLVYVTARGSWSKSITEAWLAKHNFPKAPVIFTNDKRSVALELRATLCIEDAPNELERLVDLMPALVPAKGYNTAYNNRFEEWSKLDLSFLELSTMCT